jgi:hypothetical protein
MSPLTSFARSGATHSLRLRGRRPPTVREHNSIDGARARCSDALECKPLLLKQSIEDTPGEGAMAASALERQIGHLLSSSRHELGGWTRGPIFLWYETHGRLLFAAKVIAW